MRGTSKEAIFSVTYLMPKGRGFYNKSNKPYTYKLSMVRHEKINPVVKALKMVPMSTMLPTAKDDKPTSCPRPYRAAPCRLSKT